MQKDAETMYRQDKNYHIKKICREIEEHQHTNETRDLYKQVRHLTRKAKPRTPAIEDENGNILWENKGHIGLLETIL